jgi:hypothetical protein
VVIVSIAEGNRGGRTCFFFVYLDGLIRRGKIEEGTCLLWIGLGVHPILMGEELSVYRDLWWERNKGTYLVELIQAAPLLDRALLVQEEDPHGAVPLARGKAVALVWFVHLSDVFGPAGGGG